MAPSRGRRKVTIIASDNDDDIPVVEDIHSDDDRNTQFQRPFPLKRSPTKDAPRSSRAKNTSPKSSPSKASKAERAKNTNASGRGTIASFFNAAAQRQSQQPSRLSSIPLQISTPPPSASQISLEDTTDVIDDEHGNVPILNGSRTAQAARKRKQNDVDHLSDPAIFSQSSGPLKFRKTSASTKAAPTSQQPDQRPWVERFGPIDLNELAVHTKKVADVRSLITQALTSPHGPRMIVLKGPAGSGKTATVHLLAKEMGVSVKEWRNPQDMDIGSESFRSTSAQFDEFIFMSSKYSALEVTSSNKGTNQDRRQTVRNQPSDGFGPRQLLLVEEFPVNLSRSSTILQSFRATLAAYLAMPYSRLNPPALVITIVSETLLTSQGTNDSLTPNRLLGAALLTHSSTATIEFNPIAQTFLTKALSLIAIKESRVTGRRRTPGPAVLAKLAELGDIRSAASGLEMLCLMGDNSNVWSSKISFTQPKGTTKAKTAAAEQTMTEREREALKVIGGRDSKLDLWHSVGKVVYNKRIDAHLQRRVHPSPADFPALDMSALLPTSTAPAIPEQLPDHLIKLQRSKVPENEPEQLLAELSSDIATFIASIHENMIPSCATSSTDTTIESLEACLDAISDADVLSIDRFSSGFGTGTALEGLLQEEMAYHAAVRGVVFGLPYPVKRETGAQSAKRGGNAMMWPRSLRLWRETEEIDDLIASVKADYIKALNGGQEAGKGSKAADLADDEENGFMMPSARSKMDFVLDQVPRMKKIHDARRTASGMRDRIRQLVALETLNASFSMIDGKIVRSAEDEEEEEEHLSRERRTRTGVHDEMAGMPLGLVEKDVKELVLSDDDIVDD